MPVLNFTIIRGRTPEEIQQLLDSTHAAVVEAFGVPIRDRPDVLAHNKFDQAYGRTAHDQS
jgi:Tautomerase enzyme